MRERWVRPTHTIYNLAERKPLLVRTLEQDPVLKESIEKLQGSGLRLQKLRRTPFPIRGILHPDDKAVMILDQALGVPSVDEDPNIQSVRETVDSALLFTASGPLIEREQTAIDRLNEALSPRREQLARRRLLSDRPKKELRDLSWTGAFTATALIAANLLERFGFKGPGLFAAQSLDDIGTTVANAKTVKGGERKLVQIAKDNWMVPPILIGAGLIDVFWLPSLLESPNTGSRILGGVIFSAAAVSGSITSNLKIVKDSMLTKAEREKREMSVLGGLYEGWKLNIAHPFRKYLWVGTGLSLLASAGSAAAGVLLKDPTLQTFLGQLETISAYSGLILGSAIGAGLENLRDFYKVKMPKKFQKNNS